MERIFRQRAIKRGPCTSPIALREQQASDFGLHDRFLREICAEHLQRLFRAVGIPVGHLRSGEHEIRLRVQERLQRRPGPPGSLPCTCQRQSTTARARWPPAQTGGSPAPPPSAPPSPHRRAPWPPAACRVGLRLRRAGLAATAERLVVRASASFPSASCSRAFATSASTRSAPSPAPRRPYGGARSVAAEHPEIGEAKLRRRGAVVLLRNLLQDCFRLGHPLRRHVIVGQREPAVRSGMKAAAIALNCASACGRAAGGVRYITASARLASRFFGSIASAS